jgi:hypothetical protein
MAQDAELSERKVDAFKCCEAAAKMGRTSPKTTVHLDVMRIRDDFREHRQFAFPFVFPFEVQMPPSPRAAPPVAIGTRR